MRPTEREPSSGLRPACRCNLGPPPNKNGDVMHVAESVPRLGLDVERKRGRGQRPSAREPSAGSRPASRRNLEPPD